MNRFDRFVPALVVAGLAVAILSAYWRVGEYGFMNGYSFLNLDDANYVYGNPHVRNGLTMRGVSWAFTTFHSSNYHPVTWLSHMLDVELFGLDPGWCHRVNLIIHLLNAELLFALLWRLTGSLGPSAFVAAAFGLHPLNVESVVWISERKNVLSTLFFLSSVLAYAHYAAGKKWASYGVALLLFVLGLLSKAMLVTVPVVLILLDWWPLNRITRDNLRSVCVEKIPFAVLSALFCVVTYLAQSWGGMVQTIERIPLSSRVQNALVSYAAYLGHAAWPLSLSPFYPHPATVGATIAAWKVAAAGLLLAGISLSAWLLRKRRPCLAAGWGWYLVTLVPVIGIVQIGNHALADRYMYVPLIGISIAVAWGVPSLPGNRRHGTAMMAACAIVLTSALSVLAWRQAGYWKDSVTLFSRALAVTDNNWVAMSTVGLEVVEAGRPAEGMPYLQEVVRLRPDDFMAWNNLGLAHAKIGRLAPAIESYKRALQLRPDYADAWSNLGVADIRIGRYPQAVNALKEALRSSPGQPEVWNNLGACYMEMGDYERAIDSFRTAIRLRNDYPDARYNLGIAYGKIGGKGAARPDPAE